MADQSQGPGWWIASDGKWYPPEQAPAPAAPPVYPNAVSTGQTVGPGARLAAWFLDGLLLVVTLFIGWLIWALFTVGDGQTPAKKLLGHKVVYQDSGQTCSVARMIFARGIGMGFLIGLLGTITFGIFYLVIVWMPLWRPDDRNVWDTWTGTRVVRV